MIEEQTIHMFHDGPSYYPVAFTLDPKGGNLPPVNWIPFDEPIHVQQGEAPRAGVNVEEVQADIRQHGICVRNGVVTVQAFSAPPGVPVSGLRRLH